jgi:hypothetical protein
MAIFALIDQDKLLLKYALVKAGKVTVFLLLALARVDVNRSLN